MENIIPKLNPKTVKRVLSNMYEIGLVKEMGGDTKALLNKLINSSMGFERKVYEYLNDVDPSLLGLMSDAITEELV